MSLSLPGLYLASSGSYPRTGEGTEFETLSRTMEAYERGQRSAADVLDAENDVIRRVIADQVKAGIEILTDGQIRWRDPLSHLASKLANVKIEGSAELPGTNLRFRRPVLTGPPARNASLVLNDYYFARNALGRLPTPRKLAGKLKVKPVLTGPYTLAKISLFDGSADGAGRRPHAAHAAAESAAPLSSYEARAEAYAEALAAEIEELAKASAELIQIDEPLAIEEQDWPVFEKSVGRLVEARNTAVKAGYGCDLLLHVYFQDCAALYEKLVALPVDILGLDFTCSPALVSRIACLGSPKPLALGLVDGRSAELEDPASIARQIERILPKIEGGRAYFTPSCGLEHLPQECAYAKLELLGKIRAAVNG
jgi:5-methyltetrahydropteroyltriglutamate--homocysteine methyltransferase